MIEVVVDTSFAILGLGVVLTLLRILRGPTLADRILGLDLLTTLGICLIAIFSVRANLALLLDIAVALALVSFVATVALARYLMSSRSQ